MMASVIGRMVPFFCMLAGTCLACAAAADELGTVRGTVQAEVRSRLCGVLVSDGCQVVRTDARGATSCH